MTLEDVNEQGPGIVIRQAGTNDAARIAALHHRNFDRAWQRDFVANLLQSNHGVGLLAVTAEGQLLTGFILAQHVGDEIEILSIAVDASHRRKGVAFALLAQFVHRLQNTGIERVFLEVATDNTPACALYEAHGFSAVGRRKDYYRDRDGLTQDAVVLALALNHTSQ